MAFIMLYPYFVALSSGIPSFFGLSNSQSKKGSPGLLNLPRSQAFGFLVRAAKHKSPKRCARLGKQRIGRSQAAPSSVLRPPCGPGGPQRGDHRAVAHGLRFARRGR